MKSIWNFDTIETPCSVEWSPKDQSTFVCGTYLLENQSSRIGTIYAFQKTQYRLLTHFRDDIKELSKIKTCGTLDLKYSWRSGLLGHAEANGDLSIHDSSLKTISKIDLENQMCLSLDWSSRVSYETYLNI